MGLLRPMTMMAYNYPPTTPCSCFGFAVWNLDLKTTALSPVIRCCIVFIMNETSLNKMRNKQNCMRLEVLTSVSNNIMTHVTPCNLVYSYLCTKQHSLISQSLEIRIFTHPTVSIHRKRNFLINTRSILHYILN
jgi:hypothetical protein